MKKAVRFISIIIAMVCLAYNVPAKADMDSSAGMPTGEASKDKYFADFTVKGYTPTLIIYANLQLRSESSKRISIIVSVKTEKIVELLGFTNLYLQEWDGENWVNVRTWSDDYVKYKTSYIFEQLETNMKSGRCYRLQARALYAKNGSDYQTFESTSPYIQCR